MKGTKILNPQPSKCMEENPTEGMSRQRARRVLSCRWSEEGEMRGWVALLASFLYSSSDVLSLSRWKKHQGLHQP